WNGVLRFLARLPAGAPHPPRYARRPLPQGARWVPILKTTFSRARAEMASAFHLRQPVLYVVMRGYPRDPAVRDRKERPGRQLVPLPHRLGHAVVRRLIGADHQELRRRPPAVVGGHDHHVPEPLLV